MTRDTGTSAERRTGHPPAAGGPLERPAPRSGVGVLTVEGTLAARTTTHATTALVVASLAVSPLFDGIAVAVFALVLGAVTLVRVLAVPAALQALFGAALLVYGAACFIAETELLEVSPHEGELLPLFPRRERHLKVVVAVRALVCLRIAVVVYQHDAKLSTVTFRPKTDSGVRRGVIGLALHCRLGQGKPHATTPATELCTANANCRSPAIVAGIFDLERVKAVARSCRCA